MAEVADESLAGVARVERRPHDGYQLVVEDEKGYAAWVRSQAPAPDAVPSTPRARVRYLLNDLLLRADWITLDELASVLYVSRASVSSDLKRVEEILADYDLTLEKRPHHGIRVSGSEMDRRLCLASLVVDDETGTDSLGAGERELLVTLVRVMSVNAVTLSLVQTSSACLTALGLPLRATAVQWGTSLARVALSVCLVAFTRLGIIGAALSANVCYLVAVLLDFWYIIRRRSERGPVRMLAKRARTGA